MGNCLTREEDVRYESVGARGGPATQTNILKEGNKKLVPVSNYSWKSDKPMTKEDVIKRREEFWLTSPNYNGRQEIWQALKGICEAEELELAQVIADSAGISVPTGKLTDGCYDELGNQYVLPNFCLIDPSNLVEKSSEKEINKTLPSGEGSLSAPENKASRPTSMVSNDENSQYYTKEEDGTLITKAAMNAGGKSAVGGDNVTTTLRLSNNKDIKIVLNKTDTIKQVMQIIEKHEALDPKKNNIRIIVKGKVLVKSSKLYEDLSKDSSISIVQVFISSKN